MSSRLPGVSCAVRHSVAASALIVAAPVCSVPPERENDAGPGYGVRATIGDVASGAISAGAGAAADIST